MSQMTVEGSQIAQRTQIFFSWSRRARALRDYEKRGWISGVMLCKDYPDRMTPEQARAFGKDVLNIVSQIPYGKVTIMR